jgi:hypothetical protein
MTDPSSSAVPRASSTADYHVHTTDDFSTPPHTPTPPHGRSSQLFFGICDMRTATVALDVLNLAFTLIVVLVLTCMFLLQSGAANGGTLFVWQNILHAWCNGLVMATISLLGLYGAMNWNLSCMYVAVTGWLILLIWRLMQLDWIDIVVSALLLYPHARLTMEMRTGIMTPDTFEKEEYLTESGRDFVEMAHQYISPKNNGNDAVQQQ